MTKWVKWTHQEHEGFYEAVGTDPAADPEIQARVLRAAAKNYGTNDPAMAARLTSYAIGVSIKPLPVEEERA